MRFQIVIAVIMSIGCSSYAACGSAQVAAGVIVECARVNRPAVDELASEMARRLRGESPDWSEVERAAVVAGLEIGGCALAEVVDWVVGAESLLATGRGASEARAVMARFSRAHGGATFVLPGHAQ